MEIQKQKFENMIFVIFTIIAIILFVNIVRIPKIINLLCLLFFVMILWWVRKIPDLYFQKRKLNILIILACGLGLRLFWLYSNFKTINQVSDFQVVISHAKSGVFSDKLLYYRLFPHKLLYPRMLNICGITNELGIIIFQIAMSCICMIFIYLVCIELVSDKTALIAGLIYACWPVQVVYTIIVSEEHMACMFVCIGVYGIIKLYKLKLNSSMFRRNTIKCIICSLAIGITMGLSTFLKDWSQIIIIALVLLVLVKCVFDKKMLTYMVMIIFIILSARICTQNVIRNELRETLGCDIITSNIPGYMYISMQPKWNGAWTEEGYNEWFKIEEDNDFNYKLSNDIMLKRLKDVFVSEKRQVLNLLVKKINVAYKDDYHAIWVSGCTIEGFDINMNSYKWLSILNVDMFFYSSIIMGVIVSILFNAKKRDGLTFFINLIIVGGICIVLFIESQGRYKYGIQPIWIISAAVGWNELLRIYDNHYMS